MKNKKTNRGFTLIEIISVLIILGVLTLVVADDFGADSGIDRASVEAALKSHIRYTQSKSMQSGTRVWGIRLNATLDEYYLFRCDEGVNCTWATNIVLPLGGESSEYVFTDDRLRTSLVGVSISSITIGASTPATVTLVYDELGVPYWYSGTGALTYEDPLSDTASLTFLAANVVIQLTDGAGNAGQVVVTQETGFIP